MSCIAPVEALLALDLISIPEANRNSMACGQDSINVAFEFYVNSKEDIYEERTKIGPALLNCRRESSQLEYTEYKNHVCTHRLDLADRISGLEENIKSRLALTEAKKYKSQKTMKEIEREWQVIEEKLRSLLTVDDLLGDSVIDRGCLSEIKKPLLYLLVPQSEAVVERGFSCMKMIMTDRRTNLNSESLEAFMHLSHGNKSEIKEVSSICINNSYCQCSIM